MTETSGTTDPRMSSPTDAGLYVGTATADITPAEPVPLAGFAVRLEPWEKVRAPLSAQVFAFGDAAGACTALLVCADLLWWGPDTVADLTRRIDADHGVPEGSVVLHASHTHCAPQPGLTFSPLLGRGDPAYVAHLTDVVLAAIGEALAGMEPVYAERGTGTCGFGVNRRRANPDGTYGGPDPDGPNDPEVGVLRLARPDGSTRALLVHYTCHPVVSADPQVSPDYPGAMRSALEHTVGAGVPIGFLQGCCGDINPNVVRDGEFHRGGDEEIESIGQQLAVSVGAVLDRPLRRLPPLPPGGVAVRTHSVNLPLQPPSRDELARRRETPGIDGDWARRLLAEPGRLVDQVPLRLTRVDLADGLTLVGLDAEVSVAYGQHVKRRTSGAALPIPYTNGMIGYVVTAAQLREGGYEPDQSYPYVYRAGRFAPAVEEHVLTALDEVLGDLPEAAEVPDRPSPSTQIGDQR
ncbi:hypothetical protein SAMN05421678_108280 [Actinopolymorpha cephalotaxi]|uniref:Neutral/alkaline non-lysosomal ceramidase, N-terminal n=1 Tax=Actinopolymorpha cephalotaxi TaxID=504797 RepID=A0A1I2UX38_9ACTN|nr:hypothetical protein [Actinopolymorpha cephalotaxi]NYH86694.1 hypothetical protein [Actinopolymorpha cephalotaxi]SFG79371.1 hypothetical protein SAMN05421678_108280 [Actinopolymorpha cephalotaxi]